MRLRLKQFPYLHLILPLAIATRLIAIVLKFPGFLPGWGGEMPAVARSIALGKGFASPFLIETGPTAHVAPVYPYLLSIFFRLFGADSEMAGVVALGLNIILSALVAIPLFFLAQKLFSRRVGIVSIWIWAVLPIVGRTDALYIWNTSLYTLTLTTILAFNLNVEKTISSYLWILYGFLAGFMIVLEPVSLTIVGLSYLWLIWQRFPLKTLIQILVVTLLLPAIWLVRNFLTFDEPVFIRSSFGLQLSMGTRYNDFLDESTGSLPDRNPEELEKYKQMGEVRYMQYRLADAIDWIKNNPDEYAVRIVKRVGVYWTGYRVSEIYLFYGRFELAKRIFYTLPALGAFLSLFFIKNRAFLLIAGILLFYPVVYYLTFIDLRYRLPIEPLLFGLTIGAIFTIYEQRWKAQADHV